MQVDLRRYVANRACRDPLAARSGADGGRQRAGLSPTGPPFGAGLVCSEMVSCAGLSHKNEKTLGYLRIAADEHPLAVQIFGSEPGVMAEAARMVEDAGADIVDINFGCPVRKATKTGAGANCLTSPDRACAIVDAVANQSRSRSR